MQNGKKKWKAAEGFTLIETLMAVTIFTILIGATGLLFTTLHRNQKEEIAMIERQTTAARVLEKLSNEIRRINRAEDGSYALVAAEPHQFTFFVDLDGDHKTEKVTYALEGTDLTRTVVRPSVTATGSYNYSTPPVKKVLATGVYNDTEPIFSYYGGNYDGTGDALTGAFRLVDVKVIGITLFINTPDRVAVKSPLKLETKVQMRNLK